MRAHHLAIVMLLSLNGYASAQTSDSSTMGNSSPPSFVSGSGFSPSPTVPSVAGAPNTSTPGIIGTDATPSGLPGDSARHPGFPAPLRMGR